MICSLWWWTNYTVTLIFLFQLQNSFGIVQIEKAFMSNNTLEFRLEGVEWQWARVREINKIPCDIWRPFYHQLYLVDILIRHLLSSYYLYSSHPVVYKDLVHLSKHQILLRCKLLLVFISRFHHNYLWSTEELDENHTFESFVVNIKDSASNNLINSHSCWRIINCFRGGNIFISDDTE